MLPGECSYGPLHLHEQIPRSHKVHHHSPRDGGHFGFGKSFLLTTMFTPYLLPPTWLPVIGRIDSHSCPSKCGLGQHQSKPATNAIYFWLCGCDAMFDALPSNWIEIVSISIQGEWLFWQTFFETCRPIWHEAKGKMAGIECPAILIGSRVDGSDGLPPPQNGVGGNIRQRNVAGSYLFLLPFQSKKNMYPPLCSLIQGIARLGRQRNGGSSHHRPFSCGHECHKTREHVPAGPTLKKVVDAGYVYALVLWMEFHLDTMRLPLTCCYDSQALT